MADSKPRLLWTRAEIGDLIAQTHEKSLRHPGDAEPADVIAWNDALVFFTARLLQKLNEPSEAA
jgi:hypothetical protein